MKKRIVINKGDEYRFKTEEIEKVSEENVFFFEVYEKAKRLTSEIIETMSSSREEILKTKVQFYGMGNNIIVFCGVRGGGKTSAMQSFAHWLVNADERQYMVLDSIEPSALGIGESIIKVFISRMFSCFQALYDKAQKSDETFDERQIILERQDIFEKFNRCFNNIAYMERKEEKDVYQDNLDYLSELGDSRNLRTNLFQLAEAVLAFKEDHSSKERRQKPYLVVPIDDADLSVGDIFKTCEDIRNFLSIPNTIVLMAADFDQLRDAIYQKYLNHYKTILQFDLKMKYEKKCYHMTAKFMEKMFPNGHRIDLPDMEHEIQTNTNQIYLEYKEGDKNVFDEKEWNGCNEIQEQLIKSLYVRTGIILAKKTGEIHPFLPHTLRELTHFLKLLDSMEIVDFDKACFEGMHSKNNSDMPNLLRWEVNLEILKQYYLGFWIKSCLQNKQEELIRDIDKINQYTATAEIRKKLLQYITNTTGAVTAKQLSGYIESDRREGAKSSDKENKFMFLLSIVKETMTREREFQNAIYVYFSIVLNSDFVKEFIMHTGHNEFVRFLDVPFQYGKLKNTPLGDFSFKASDFVEYLGSNDLNVWDDTGVTTFLAMFCKDADAVQLRNKMKEQKTMVATMWHFNACDAILGVLSNYHWLTNEKISGSESLGEQSSLEDAEPIDIPQMDSQRDLDSANVLISAKNIVCNLEVRSLLEDSLNDFLPKWNAYKADDYLKAYKELYNTIDNIINSMGYLHLRCTIGAFLNMQLEKVYTRFWSCSYLANLEYRDKYFKNIKKDIEVLLAASIRKVRFLKEEVSLDAFTENAIQAGADVLSMRKEYSVLKDSAIQKSDFYTLIEVRDNIMQAWKEFSSNVTEVENLAEDKRDNLLQELKSVLESNRIIKENSKKYRYKR